MLYHLAKVMNNTDKYQPCTEIWEPILKEMNFDLAIGAHIHHYTHLPKEEQGNPYPVFIGDGPRPENSKMMVLKKEGDKLTLTTLDTSGNVVEESEINLN